MATRPNYYRLLKLDPDEHEWSVIERRIEELAQDYKKLGSAPPTALENEARCFEIYLERLEGGIRQVMQDQSLRRAEAEARRQELPDEMVQLNAMLRALQARGSYTKADVADIAIAVSGFHKSMIEAKIRAFGLKEDDGKPKPQPKRPTRPMLSNAEAKIIKDSLLGLGLSDLYTFLSETDDAEKEDAGTIGPNSSDKDLKEAYEKQKLRLSKLPKVKAEHKVRRRHPGTGADASTQHGRAREVRQLPERAQT